MDTPCIVAQFIRERIDFLGKPQKDVAVEAGFEHPNVITMIKQGKTKLPIAKIGPMATALETDPLQLLKLCLSHYYPDTWKAIEPFLESALTEDEVRLLGALRTSVGGPYLSALSSESKRHLESFMKSLRLPTQVH